MRLIHCLQLSFVYLILKFCTPSPPILVYFIDWKLAHTQFQMSRFVLYISVAKIKIKQKLYRFWLFIILTGNIALLVFAIFDYFTVSLQLLVWISAFWSPTDRKTNRPTDRPISLGIEATCRRLKNAKSKIFHTNNHSISSQKLWLVLTVFLFLWS